jgi:peptide/nickel transport system ATP-binding protein
MEGPGSSAQEGHLISVQELSVRTEAGRTIVRDAGLHLDPGQAIGIVGESGSGKSMTAKALIGLLPPGLSASGQVRLGGRNLLELRERELRKVRGREVALVMQDPFTMLNPLLRCGLQVTEGLVDGRGRQLRKAARRAEAVRRLAEVGILDPGIVDRFPFELSGGMRQRVGIAAALTRDPGVLIADEPSTALDVTTQRMILDLLRKLQRSRGMGLILITHDLRVAAATCERIYVMYAGNTLEVASSHALDVEPRHPYTLGLLSSEPPIDRRLARLPVIEGTVSRPDDVATMCAFAPRCKWAQSRCHEGRPLLAPLDEAGRWTACIRSCEIREEMRAARQVEESSATDHALLGSEPLVSIRNLVKSFGPSANALALAGVSLEVLPCESVGLVGESGSGKTTLGRCVMGLEQATSGEIEVDGLAAQRFAELPSADRARLRHKVQMVFQDPYSSLNPVRSIGSTLLEAIIARDPNVRRAGNEVSDLLRRVGLPSEYSQRKPAALSGGERQRVAIARALAMRPQIIICDEPVSALDVSVQAQVLNLLTALRAEYEVSYLFITHDLAVVRQIAERIYVLHKGKIVEHGPSASVLGNPTQKYTKELVSSVPGATRTLGAGSH